MKIVIFSDSHGNRTNLRTVLEDERPGMVFHLGDGKNDIEEVMEAYPQLELHAVLGNCDWRRQGQVEELVTVEGVPILLSHGHLHDVKNGYSRYIAYGRSKGARVLLFGHTHRACIWEDRELTVLNPGSAGEYFAPTYAVLVVKNGALLNAEIRQVPHPVFEHG